MHILATCPSCVHVLQFGSSETDKRKRCPSCGCLFQVPPLDKMDKAMKIIQNANTMLFVDEDGKKYG